MKREIKFRGQRVDNGEWIYGDYHHRAGGVQCIIRMEPDDNGKAVYIVHQVDPDTVGQFTGLLDKNGLKSLAQQFTQGGDFSPTLKECYMEGYKQAQISIIEKVSEWLGNNFVCFVSGAKRGVHSNQFATVDEMVNKFRKAMEE